MISVLIPVFNKNIFELVLELSRQLKQNNAGGEIIVFDDHSDFEFREANREIISLEAVSYKELDENYGRIKIRQLLSEAAQFDWLLFLDGDSKIIEQNFLSNYITACTKEVDVIVGGRKYESEVPSECSKRLHWNYGTVRESVKGSSKAFHSNNFLIRKDTFTQLNFPGGLSGYGHEDTWMDIQFQKTKKIILYIDNPVLHDGVEGTEVFLEKTTQALQNLLVLAKRSDEKLWIRKVRLYKAFYQIKKTGCSGVYLTLYKLWRSKIDRNLFSCHPSLFFFDCYRLYQLIRLSKQLDVEKPPGRS